MDGVCKLGDFGLVVNLKEVSSILKFEFIDFQFNFFFFFPKNLCDAVEGDSKYLAPEVLSGKFSMKADIFSLGITLLELACDLDLPANGKLWHELRQGSLPSSITRRKLHYSSWGEKIVTFALFRPFYSEIFFYHSQASLIWGFPILPILSSYGEKKIKYGLNMVFHWKSIKNSEK